MMERDSTQQHTTFGFNPCREMMHHDALDSAIWAATFIWAGLVMLFAGQSGYSSEQGWALFFVGAGVLVLLEAGIRLRQPTYGRSVFGTIIWGIVLLALGTDGWAFMLPAIFILVGIYILRSG